MRLSRRVRAIALLIAPGLVLLARLGDDAEAGSDCADDIRPVELVQLALNLTEHIGHVPLAAQGQLRPGRRRSLVSLQTVMSKVTSKGVPSLSSKDRGAVSALILLVCVVILMVVTSCLLAISGDEAETPRSGRKERDASSSGRTDVTSLEEGDREPERCINMDLNADIYSTVLQGFLRDGVAILSGKSRRGSSMAIHRFRMISVLVLLFANYIFQFGVLVFSYSFVVRPAIANVQSIYRDFHAICFTPDGMLDKAKCSTEFKGMNDLCGLVFTYNWFMLLVLVIWSMAMVREFRSTERMCRVLFNIESTTHIDNVVEYSRGVEHVTHLTAQLRLAIFLVVMLPKLLITVSLGCLGTVWLAATADVSEVILNAVALEFIIQIDELLFDAVVPSNAREELSRFKLTLNESHSPGTFVVDAKMEYLASLFYLVILVGVPPIYMTLGQRLPFVNVYPGFRRAEVVEVCDPYLQAPGRGPASGARYAFPTDDDRLSLTAAELSG
eukprot:CAMPEP_0175641906 /NCGR_PEP_ID=MMETSP0097-20121207/4994_1 /TAXON_ID=311494 /ORGANISM="Alexandrium monilatum, Strain CCMP3105" /LENGTH=499 /DNA_ID=CAMNT_0016947681 /DNA_START=28 /DNA_END=1526 /DNA_ORIENTATION=+